MPIQESLPVPEVEIVTSNPTKPGGNFSVDEDLFLISAWLNISMDANNTYRTTHSISSLSSRWGNINRETSRFDGFMAKVKAQNQSGATDEDKKKKTAFAFEHCWVVLKNQPKWSVLKERSKGLPQTPSSIDQVGSNDDNTMMLERPIGRKAEKAKADIEKEMLRLETIREEGRIMTMDTSGMNEKERLYFENIKDQILARKNLE
ncbi:hypothetical protein ACB092_05G127000 [Castanea dentata]